jgi:hypothetical protein
MKTITQITNVYEFSELSDKAKAKARDWYREASTHDDHGVEFVIDDAKCVFALCGITIYRVYYSGFWSQGDGACFEGTWCASDVKTGSVKDYAPVDETLHRIAAEFERIAAEFPCASFSVKHRGYYQHENCTEFSFSFPDDSDNESATTLASARAETDLEKAAKDAMRWIYQTLEKEYKYHNADEQVDESILCNCYTFTEEGERFGD